MAIPDRVRPNIEKLLSDVQVIVDRLDAEADTSQLRTMLEGFARALKWTAGVTEAKKPAAAKPAKQPPLVSPKPPRASKAPTPPRLPSRTPPRKAPPPQFEQEEEEDDWHAPPAIKGNSHWRIVALERVSGRFAAKVITLLEEVGRERKESSTRVWCRELLKGQSWSYLPEVFWENDRLQLVFRVDRYIGMPSELQLEIPKVLKPGALVRLFTENDEPFGSFRIRAVEVRTNQEVKELEARYRT